MRHTHQGKRSVSPSRFVILALGISILFLGIISQHANPKFTSSEVKFADDSIGGLSIVPASCASDPHFAGECDPPGTCAVWFSSNPIVAGGASILYWWSAYGHYYVYINNVGYVPASGATWVAPGSSTDYSCVSVGYGGTDGWHSAVLTVYQNCSFNGVAVGHGSSVTGYQASTVPFGTSCAAESRYCSNGSLSGSYAYASCGVTPPANCSQDGVTVLHGQSRTYYSSRVSPIGTLCSSNSVSRSCNNGTLSGSSAYQYATCSCAEIDYCSGQTITHRSVGCVDTAVSTCTSPAFCTDGFNYCKYSAPSFNAASGGLTGHLQVTPSIVRTGDPSKVYWNVSNVWSCSVTENNSTISDVWSTRASVTGGNTTSALRQQTVYTLSCNPYPEHTFTPETATVNIVPVFNEN